MQSEASRKRSDRRAPQVSGDERLYFGRPKPSLDLAQNRLAVLTCVAAGVVEATDEG